MMPYVRRGAAFRRGMGQASPQMLLYSTPGSPSATEMNVSQCSDLAIGLCSLLPAGSVGWCSQCQVNTSPLPVPPALPAPVYASTPDQSEIDTQAAAQQQAADFLNSISDSSVGTTPPGTATCASWFDLNCATGWIMLGLGLTGIVLVLGKVVK